MGDDGRCPTTSRPAVRHVVSVRQPTKPAIDRFLRRLKRRFGVLSLLRARDAVLAPGGTLARPRANGRNAPHRRRSRRWHVRLVIQTQLNEPKGIVRHRAATGAMPHGNTAGGGGRRVIPFSSSEHFGVAMPDSLYRLTGTIAYRRTGTGSVRFFCRERLVDERRCTSQPFAEEGVNDVPGPIPSVYQSATLKSLQRCWDT